jgi:hypothetical protein
MAVHTELVHPLDVTDTASSYTGEKVGSVRRTVRRQLNAARLFYVTSNYGVGARMMLDQEEAVHARLREAEQRMRRSQAHARIEAKRKANPADRLLAWLELPEYKIEISNDVLRDIIESYPEDD